MRLLLDTHVILWMLTDDPILGSTVRDAIVEAEEVYWSTASLWEIGIKHSLGRADFEMKAGWEKKIPAELQKSGIQRLDVEPSHCGTVSTLPLHHRDPFDRMLVAQAISEDLTLVTRDPFVRAYPIRWVW